MSASNPNRNLEDQWLTNLKDAVLYAAVYKEVDSALDDPDSFEQLHKAQVIGKYDAAVIDNEEGKPHVVKRADRPAIRLIPEWFGSGKLPRRELHEVAQALDSGEAALMVIGEPTVQKGFEQAVTRAANIVRRDLDALGYDLAPVVSVGS
jgi:hypothetical protein